MSIYWNVVNETGQNKNVPVSFDRNLRVNVNKNNVLISAAPYLIDPVAVKTTGALPAYTATGTTLTRNANGSLAGDSAVFDDYNLFIIGRRILVDSVGTVNDSHNGVYEVTALGNGGAPWVLTRTTDSLANGTVVYITEGTVYGRTSFMQVNENGNTAVFQQYSAVPELSGANVGAGGLGIFDSLAGTVLQFNKLEGSATVSVTQPGGAGTSLVFDVNSAGIAHGDITGLLADDHSQYALLAGRTSGQTLVGGTALGANLVLNSTSHVTKGRVLVPELTASTNPTSGALVVSGGVGIGGSVNVAGNITLNGNIVLGAGTVDGVDVSALDAKVTAFVSGTNGAALNNLTSSIVNQLVQMGANSISATQWGYLSTMNQSLRTTDTVSFDEVSTTITTASQPFIDHNSLLGLTVGDVHTQYLLLAGRNGGQTIIGGTGSGDTLVLRSTSNGTKGRVSIVETTSTTNPTTGAFTVAGGVGFNSDLQVAGNTYIGTNLTVTGGLVNGVNIVNLSSTVGNLATRLHTSSDLTNAILQNAIANLSGITITAPQWSSLANPNVAQGVVTTDGSNKVSFAILPTGTTSSTVAVGDHTHDFRRNGTVAGNTNVATPFALPLLTETSGAFRVSIYASTGNGPAAVFELCKNSTSSDAGAVSRVVSQIANGAELSMSWAHGQSPRVFHSTLTGASNAVTYTYTVSL
jgi:hypothetical protein